MRKTRCRWSGAWTAIATRRRTCGPPARFTTWRGKSRRRIVRCGARLDNDKGSVPTAQGVNCVTKDPSGTGSRGRFTSHPALGGHGAVAEVAGAGGAGCTALREVHQPGRTGALPAAAVQDPHAERSDKLRGLPSMSRELMNESTQKTGNVVDNDKSNAVAAGQNVSMTLAQVREQLEGHEGQAILAVRRRTGEHGGVPGCRREGVSERGAGVGRSGFAPRLHEADGRLNGAGRVGRLHKAAR